MLINSEFRRRRIFTRRIFRLSSTWQYSSRRRSNSCTDEQTKRELRLNFAKRSNTLNLLKRGSSALLTFRARDINADCSSGCSINCSPTKLLRNLTKPITLVIVRRTVVPSKVDSNRFSINNSRTKRPKLERSTKLVKLERKRGPDNSRNKLDSKLNDNDKRKRSPNRGRR